MSSSEDWDVPSVSGSVSARVCGSQPSVQSHVCGPGTPTCSGRCVLRSVVDTFRKRIAPSSSAIIHPRSHLRASDLSVSLSLPPRVNDSRWLPSFAQSLSCCHSSVCASPVSMGTCVASYYVCDFPLPWCVRVCSRYSAHVRTPRAFRRFICRTETAYMLYLSVSPLIDAVPTIWFVGPFAVLPVCCSVVSGLTLKVFQYLVRPSKQ